MPIDPRIALGGQPVPFNNPFERLGQIRQQQQQQALGQQTLQSNQIKLTEQQQAIEDSNKFYAILGKPGQTADSAAEEIRQQVPSMYQPYLKSRAELDTKAADLAKAHAEVGKLSQEYAAPYLQIVEKSGYNPAVFDFAIQNIQSHFQDFPADQLRQRVAQGGPEAIKAIVDGFKSPQQQTADATVKKTEAELPGVTADAAVKTQIAAGTVGGLTPAQQATTALQARTTAATESNARTNAAREGREQKTADQANQLFGTPGGPTGLSQVQPGQKDEALLATLPTATADKVKALVEGRLQLPTRFTKGDTYWQGLLDAATRYDPTFDAVNYNSRSKTRQDFTSGKSAATVNALNTVAQHLDRLSTSADALKNTWSPAYNSVANFLSRHVGSKTVTNFETDKKAVVDELTRAWRQSGGTEQDIKSWSSVLDAANSPDQLHGAIAEMSHLLEGKLSALESQYQQGMGTDTVKAITPDARAVLSKLQQQAGEAPAPAEMVWVRDANGKLVQKAKP